METIDPRELKPHPKNVKIHTKKQVEGIAEAIKLLGIFKDPIVIDKKKLVWIGNGRLEAALLLEMPLVPIIYLDHLTAKNRKALMILDNRINESKWNKENMMSILGDIQDFDFKIFNMELDEFRPPAEITEDDAPDPRNQTDILPGDIFKLGDHKLMCGDSSNEEMVKELLQDEKMNSVTTDPPYGVDYGKKQEYLQTLNECNRITTPIENDDLKIENYQRFIENWLKLIPLSNYNTLYIFQSGSNYHKCRLALELLNFYWGADLIWKKNHQGFGRKDYKFKHEPILYCWKGKHKFYGPNNRNTILEYDRPHVSDLHPTMKPIALMAQLLTDGSKEGMNIYDPFGGSGSTLIACEQTNRKCFMMEIDPIYTQVIIDRWEKFTKRKAIKLK